MKSQQNKPLELAKKNPLLADMLKKPTNYIRNTSPYLLKTANMQLASSNKYKLTTKKRELTEKSPLKENNTKNVKKSPDTVVNTKIYENGSESLNKIVEKIINSNLKNTFFRINENFQSSKKISPMVKKGIYHRRGSSVILRSCEFSKLSPRNQFISSKQYSSNNYHSHQKKFTKETNTERWLIDDLNLIRKDFQIKSKIELINRKNEELLLKDDIIKTKSINIRSKTAELKNCQKLLNERTNELNLIHTNLQETKNMIKNLKNEYYSIDQKINKIKKEANSKDDEYEQLKANLDFKKTEIENLAAKIVKNTVSFEAIKKELSRKDTILKEKNIQLKNKQNEQDHKNGHFEKLIIEYENVKTNLSKKNLKKKQDLSDSSFLHYEKMLEKEIKEVNAELAKIEGELQHNTKTYENKVNLYNYTMNERNSTMEILKIREESIGKLKTDIIKKEKEFIKKDFEIKHVKSSIFNVDYDIKDTNNKNKLLEKEFSGQLNIQKKFCLRKIIKTSYEKKIRPIFRKLQNLKINDPMQQLACLDLMFDKKMLVSHKILIKNMCGMLKFNVPIRIVANFKRIISSGNFNQKMVLLDNFRTLKEKSQKLHKYGILQGVFSRRQAHVFLEKAKVLSESFKNDSNVDNFSHLEEKFLSNASKNDIDFTSSSKTQPKFSQEIQTNYKKFCEKNYEFIALIKNLTKLHLNFISENFTSSYQSQDKNHNPFKLNSRELGFVSNSNDSKIVEISKDFAYSIQDMNLRTNINLDCKNQNFGETQNNFLDQKIFEVLVNNDIINLIGSTAVSMNDSNQTIDDQLVHTIMQDQQKNLSCESMSDLKEQISTCKNMHFESITESQAEEIESKNTSFQKIYEKPSFVQLSPEVNDEDNFTSSSSKIEEQSNKYVALDKRSDESLHTILETNSETFFDNTFDENEFLKTNSFSFKHSSKEQELEHLKSLDNFENIYNCSKDNYNLKESLSTSAFGNKTNDKFAFTFSNADPEMNSKHNIFSIMNGDYDSQENLKQKYSLVKGSQYEESPLKFNDVDLEQDVMSKKSQFTFNLSKTSSSARTKSLLYSDTNSNEYLHENLISDYEKNSTDSKEYYDMKSYNNSEVNINYKDNSQQEINSCPNISDKIDNSIVNQLHDTDILISELEKNFLLNTTNLLGSDTENKSEQSNILVKEDLDNIRSLLLDSESSKKDTPECLLLDSSDVGIMNLDSDNSSMSIKTLEAKDIKCLTFDEKKNEVNIFNKFSLVTGVNNFSNSANLTEEIKNCINMNGRGGEEKQIVNDDLFKKSSKYCLLASLKSSVNSLSKDLKKSSINQNSPKNELYYADNSFTLNNDKLIDISNENSILTRTNINTFNGLTSTNSVSRIERLPFDENSFENSNNSLNNILCKSISRQSSEKNTIDSLNILETVKNKKKLQNRPNKYQHSKENLNTLSPLKNGNGIGVQYIYKSIKKI